MDSWNVLPGDVLHPACPLTAEVTALGLRETLLHIPLLVFCCYGTDRARSRSVFRYRIRKWRAYKRALINRGRLAVGFDERAITAWRHTEPATGPSAQRRYADLAIECALVFKSVYHLSLRAAQGFLSSVVELMQLPLPIPDYSTVSRRQGAVQMSGAALPQSCPRHDRSESVGSVGTPCRIDRCALPGVSVDLGEILRRYGPAYRATHFHQLSRSQRRVMSAIARCRMPDTGSRTVVTVPHASEPCYESERIQLITCGDDQTQR